MYIPISLIAGLAISFTSLAVACACLFVLRRVRREMRLTDLETIVRSANESVRGEFMTLGKILNKLSLDVRRTAKELDERIQRAVPSDLRGYIDQMIDQRAADRVRAAQDEARIRAGERDEAHLWLRAVTGGRQLLAQAAKRGLPTGIDEELKCRLVIVLERHNLTPTGSTSSSGGSDPATPLLARGRQKAPQQ